ncbi:MAG: cobalamin-dependent protein [Gammaproteobacteria bacterium]|nr:cobalamin-dependent protein [Gammaproteobacteria bacterium]
MSTIDTSARAARRLRDHRDDLARAANEAFLERHPEWLERFGERARIHGEADARFHVDFLAAALELSRPDPFRDYLTWTAHLLEQRGMAAADLYEHLGDVAAAAGKWLPAAEQAQAESLAGDALRQAREAGPLDWGQPAGALAVTASLYTEAALRGDRQAARNLLEEALAQGVDLRDLYVDVLQAAQYEVGRRWFENRITVAEEHMATVVTQAMLTQLYPRLPRPDVQRGRAVVTGVRNELHQVGAHMVADFLESDGWSVRFLGTQIPHEGIVSLVAREGLDLVGISVTMATNLAAARELIEALRALDPGPRILVGGAAFRTNPGMWREFGAHGMASDLAGAVETARGLATVAGDGAPNQRHQPGYGDK